MKTSQQTILITGGGSGIGLAIAQAFACQDNQLILVGRDDTKLTAAAAPLANTRIFQADLTQATDMDRLVRYLETEIGQLSLLINNAGIARAYQLSAQAGAETIAQAEFATNFFAVVRLTEKLLPLLGQQSQAAIVNISSIVSYVPSTRLSTYSASKAALHSYTQSLRLTLEQTTPQVQVFEVFPPFVDTPMTQAFSLAKLPASVIADDLLAALAASEFEVHNGMAKSVYANYLQAPDQVVRTFNQL